MIWDGFAAIPEIIHFAFTDGFEMAKQAAWNALQWIGEQIKVMILAPLQGFQQIAVKLGIIDPEDIPEQIRLVSDADKPKPRALLQK